MGRKKKTTVEQIEEVAATVERNYLNIDFNDDFFIGLAHDDYEESYFRTWEVFKNDLETGYWAVYGEYFDENDYNTYVNAFTNFDK